MEGVPLETDILNYRESKESNACFGGEVQRCRRTMLGLCDYTYGSSYQKNSPTDDCLTVYCRSAQYTAEASRNKV